MMKKYIASIVTIVVLVVGVFYYFNSGVGARDGAANVVGVDTTMPSECSTAQGDISEANWQKCQRFFQQVLDQTSASDDAQIIRLRGEIFNVLQQISALDAQ